jgi:geranylgeranyl pyrophosphate synthase
MEENIEKFLKETKEIIDKKIEKFLPRKVNQKYLKLLLGKPSYKYSPEAFNEAISKPIWDFLDRGGKRWRPALFLLIYEALGGNPKEVLDFAIIPELIHNSTLIHDDIEDLSEERRGKPALHLIFGQDIAVNLGDAFYFIPLLPIFKTKRKIDKIKIYQTCLQELIRVTIGQATDISWHRGLANAERVTEKEYLQMCANKTGCIPRMAAKMAAILAERNEKEIELFGRFAETIGIAFQIQDDILNLTGEKFAAKKGGLGEDITEGKRSLLVIYTLKKASSKDRKRLLKILSLHTKNQRMRNEAIKIIKKYGAIEYAKKRAEELVKKAWGDIDKILPPSRAKEKLKAFTRYLIEREI